MELYKRVGVIGSCLSSDYHSLDLRIFRSFKSIFDSFFNQFISHLNRNMSYVEIVFYFRSLILFLENVHFKFFAVDGNFIILDLRQKISWSISAFELDVTISSWLTLFIQGNFGWEDWSESFENIIKFPGSNHFVKIFDKDVIT